MANTINYLLQVTAFTVKAKISISLLNSKTVFWYRFFFYK